MPNVFTQDLSELSPWIRAEVEFVEPVSAGSHGGPVRRVQEWLNLHGHGVVVDGLFGPATTRAIVAFQEDNFGTGTGEVDEDTFGLLVHPMVAVLRQRLDVSVPLAEGLLDYSRAHLDVHPREIGGPNSGPWVRLYMNGRQGEAFSWCAGFVTFLLDQAAQSLQIEKPIDGSVSCDTLAAQAGRVGLFLPEVQAPGKLTPGSLFLVRRVDGDWTHTGIVTDVYDDAFGTVEGNTNDAGQREGVEVCARIRGYSGKDFVLI